MLRRAHGQEGDRIGREVLGRLALLFGLMLGGALAASAQPYEEGDYCNDDTQCRGSLICEVGVCTRPACTSDSQCGFKKICTRSGCVDVECKSNSECGGGRLCNSAAHECVDCFNNTQCGDREICSSMSCVSVQCTSDSHCAFAEKCATGNTCAPRCSPGQTWVAAANGCGACVTASASRCGGPGDCAIDQVCGTSTGRAASGSGPTATGRCIDACGPRPEIVALQRVFQRLNQRLPYVVDGSPVAPGNPPCPQCQVEIDLAPLRGKLESARVAEPVTVKLLDSRGAVVADLGTFAPQGGNRFDHLATRHRIGRGVSLTGDGCGYRLEVGNQRGQTMASANVCLGSGRR
ncbi:MAG: hypothetical protein DWQ36_17795 [Acidobacteria bacterium]|nr:MAG: hypothetical protein DWQ30_15755 [Acidobacteriota bacterium]REK04294.1 MAG: hypothetical protein DWQ36_17795 [Acidobacteriota bacterium]